MGYKLADEIYQIPITQLGLTPTEKMVYVALAFHAKRYDNLSRPSIKTICVRTGLGERTVYRAIGRLKTRGFVVIAERDQGRVVLYAVRDVHEVLIGDPPTPATLAPTPATQAGTPATLAPLTPATLAPTPATQAETPATLAPIPVVPGIEPGTTLNRVLQPVAIRTNESRCVGSELPGSGGPPLGVEASGGFRDGRRTLLNGSGESSTRRESVL